MSRRDSLTCRWNLRFFFWMFKKFARQGFSQNSHRVMVGVLNPSRILLNLVSVSQKVREMWDKFVRCWRPMKLNYVWFETKRQARVSYDYRASVARQSRLMYANSRRILTDWETKMRIWHSGRETGASVARHSRCTYANSRRTLAIFTAIFVRHTQMCRQIQIQCDSKWKVSLIRAFSRNFGFPTSR